MAGKSENSTVEKYGIGAEDIRFEMDDWVLVTHEREGGGLDCVHACNQDSTIEDAVQSCYALIRDSRCPGCGERMPDAIQGLFQMANMDTPGGIPEGYYQQVLERIIKKKWKEIENTMFIQAGIGSPKKTKT